MRKGWLVVGWVVGILGMQVSSRGAYLDFDPCKPHGGTVICGWGIIIPVIISLPSRVLPRFFHENRY